MSTNSMPQLLTSVNVLGVEQAATGSTFDGATAPSHAAQAEFDAELAQALLAQSAGAAGSEARKEVQSVPAGTQSNDFAEPDSAGERPIQRSEKRAAQLIDEAYACEQGAGLNSILSAASASTVHGVLQEILEHSGSEQAFELVGSVESPLEASGPAVISPAMGQAASIGSPVQGVGHGQPDRMQEAQGGDSQFGIPAMGEEAGLTALDGLGPGPAALGTVGGSTEQGTLMDGSFGINAESPMTDGPVGIDQRQSSVGTWIRQKDSSGLAQTTPNTEETALSERGSGLERVGVARRSAGQLQRRGQATSGRAVSRGAAGSNRASLNGGIRIPNGRSYVGGREQVSSQSQGLHETIDPSDLPGRIGHSHRPGASVHRPGPTAHSLQSIVGTGVEHHVRVDNRPINVQYVLSEAVGSQSSALSDLQESVVESVADQDWIQELVRDAYGVLNSRPIGESEISGPTESAQGFSSQGVAAANRPVQTLGTVGTAGDGTDTSAALDMIGTAGDGTDTSAALDMIGTASDEAGTSAGFGDGPHSATVGLTASPEGIPPEKWDGVAVIRQSEAAAAQQRRPVSSQGRGAPAVELGEAAKIERSQAIARQREATANHQAPGISDQAGTAEIKAQSLEQPAAQPTQLDEPISSRSVIDQIVEKIDIETGAVRQKVIIGLEPESLGRVEVRLEVERGRVVAGFAAETAETRRILRLSADKLVDALKAQGLDVTAIRVAVSPPAQSELAHNDLRSEFAQSQSGNMSDSNSHTAGFGQSGQRDHGRPYSFYEAQPNLPWNGYGEDTMNAELGRLELRA
ncbi:MAG: flagellar hook-length control protein FliK [Bacillota bacterium]|nr:flagellar hook-length control protein FliK [Bacillota bacterium]